jgi:putative oxidoreductase
VPLLDGLALTGIAGRRIREGTAIRLAGIGAEVNSGYKARWGDTMERTHDYLLALGRVLMSGLFVWGGYGKLMAPGVTTQLFAQVGVPLPAVMVWVAILVELVGGIMLLIGFKTQWAAGLLAIWSLITGFAVHLVAGVSATDAMVAYDNMIHFYKNLAMAGGFLFVLVYGAGRLSIDGRLLRTRRA